MSETKEKKSEGKLLYELMRILGYEDETIFIRIVGRNHLIEELENVEEKYVHISAHGEYHKKLGTCLETPRNGRVYHSDLEDIWIDKKKSEIPELVVLSACQAGHVDMARAFYIVGCKYCLAPLNEILFEDAAVFLTLFYKLLIGEQKSPWIAFKNIKYGLSQILPTLSGAWSFYERGEKVIFIE
nr:CHAT domain-containing protein [Candidatus Freyarchaeota archaeon]